MTAAEFSPARTSRIGTRTAAPEGNRTSTSAAASPPASTAAAALAAAAAQVPVVMPEREAHGDSPSLAEAVAPLPSHCTICRCASATVSGSASAARPCCLCRSWNNCATNGIRRPASAARRDRQRPRAAGLPATPAPCKDVDPIGQHGQQIDGVRGEDHRHVLLAIEPHEQLDHVRLAGRVEAGGRLVEQQDVRLHGQHAGQAHPLLLPVAEVVDRPMAKIGGIDRGERLFDALGHLGFREAQVSRAERHVLFH